jgi:hypothetical protein
MNLAKIPATDPLLILTAGMLLFWMYSDSIQDESRSRTVQVFLGILLTYELIIYQTGGLAAQRYAAPMFISLLTYFISTLNLESQGSRLHGQPLLSLYRSRTTLTAIVSIVIVASFLFAHRYGQSIRTLVAEKIAVRDRALYPSSAEVKAYQDMQSALPEGATVLVSLTRNYLLDFKRNRILVNDFPEMAGPPPGWPQEKGGEFLAEYLRRSGVQYVAVMCDNRTLGSLREVLDAPVRSWGDIVTHAETKFAADLKDRPFRDSLVYKSSLCCVYQVK